ncbi:MAG: hypothetical protein Alpg2KO_31940 [Alphaproteobacteria bacterium]
MAEGQKSGMDEEIAMFLLLGVVCGVCAMLWFGTKLIGGSWGGVETMVRTATKYTTWVKYEMVAPINDSRMFKIRHAVLETNLFGTRDDQGNRTASAAYLDGLMTNKEGMNANTHRAVVGLLVCHEVYTPNEAVAQASGRDVGINSTMAGQYEGQYRWLSSRSFIERACADTLLGNGLLAPLKPEQQKAMDKGEYVTPMRLLEFADGSQIVRPLRNEFTLTRIAEAGPIWAFNAVLALLISIPILFSLFHKKSTSRFKKRLDLKQFIQEQAKVWKAITPAAVDDPLTDTSGRWAEALTPDEWLKKEGILMIDNTPDREGVRAAFIKQLRKPWFGPKRLSPHARALCAAMALKGNGRPGDCDHLLAKLNTKWMQNGKSIEKAMKKDGELRKEVDGILADPALGGKLFEAARLHAFEETAMATMLDWARSRGGVMASAEFLWLKSEDRGLWYVLNNVGRPTYHVEASGALAHWKVELAMGRPLPEPDVDEAIFGLEEFLGLNEATPAAA